jgi:Spy/CpxP family protein refolding chaperone
MRITLSTLIRRTTLLTAATCLSTVQCLAAPPTAKSKTTTNKATSYKTASHKTATKHKKDLLDLTPLQAKQLTNLKAKMKETGKKSRAELAEHKKTINNLLVEQEINREKVISEQDKIYSLENAIARAKLTYRLEVADILTPKQRALLRQLVESKDRHRAS